MAASRSASSAIARGARNRRPPTLASESSVLPQSASVAGVWQSYEIYALWMLVVGGRLLASLVACRDAAMTAWS